MCNNEVVQYVPSGYDYKAITMKCGNTDIHGEALYCEECEAKFEKENRHPDYCRHGRYLHTDHDIPCGQCELEG